MTGSIVKTWEDSNVTRMNYGVRHDITRSNDGRVVLRKAGFQQSEHPNADYEPDATIEMVIKKHDTITYPREAMFAFPLSAFNSMVVVNEYEGDNEDLHKTAIAGTNTPRECVTTDSAGVCAMTAIAANFPNSPEKKEAEAVVNHYAYGDDPKPLEKYINMAVNGGMTLSILSQGAMDDEIFHGDDTEMKKLAVENAKKIWEILHTAREESPNAINLLDVELGMGRMNKQDSSGNRFANTTAIGAGILPLDETGKKQAVVFKVLIEDK